MATLLSLSIIVEAGYSYPFRISRELFFPVVYLMVDLTVRILEHKYAISKKVCVMKDARLVFTGLSVLSLLSYLGLFLADYTYARVVFTTIATAFFTLISVQTIYLLYRSA